MRKEPYDIGSYVHVFKRGARGMPITKDQDDQLRFVRALYYMNDEYVDANWLKLGKRAPFHRPDSWPRRMPLTHIICYTLMPNHLHILVKETQDDGISRFMQKLGQSMSNSFNEKYEEKGSIFQGSYKARTIQSDRQLRYVTSYIMVKNVFELYPYGGLHGAQKNFERAWGWAGSYPFSSLGEYLGLRRSPAIESALFEEIFKNQRDFMTFSHDVIMGGKWHEADFE